MNVIILTGKTNYKKEFEKMTVFQVSTKDGYGDNAKWNNHSCVVFRKNKEYVDRYVDDGSLVEVQGELHYKKIGDKTYSEIIVNRITRLYSEVKTNAETYKEIAKQAESELEEDIPF